MGTEALESNLDTATSCVCCVLEAEEVTHGGHWRLFQIEVGLGSEHRQGQGGVGLNGGGHDDDVRVVVACQQGVQVFVDSSGFGQGPSGRGIWVGHGDEFHYALCAEPFEVVEVMRSEAMDSHQGNPGGCGPRCRGCFLRRGCSGCRRFSDCR